MKQKFFFPLNYDYSNKLLGIIDYKLLIPLIVFGGFIIITLHNFELTFFIKTTIFISVFLPISLILNSQVYNEPFYLFIFAVFKHILNGKIYLYKRVIWCGININHFNYLYLFLYGLEYLK